MQGLSTSLVALTSVLAMLVAGHLWLSRAPGSGLMAAFCGIFGLQAGLLLVQTLAPSVVPTGLRPTAAASLPPLLYLFFLLGTTKRRGKLVRNDALHALPSLWILTLTRLPGLGELVDVSMVVLEAGYGLALLSMDRSGMARGGDRRGGLLTSAAFLGIMALVDGVIVMELAGGGLLVQSWGLRLGIGLMLATALALFVFAWRDPEWFRHTAELVAEVEAPALPPTPAPPSAAEDDAAGLLCQRFDAFLSETRAYTEFGLSLADVAKRLGVSPRQLSDAVNRVHAKGFRTLLNDRKVEEAARLLADPAMAKRSVTDIMFDAGFQTKSSFNKEFVGRTGMTPSDYRQQKCR